MNKSKVDPKQGVLLKVLPPGLIEAKRILAEIRKRKEKDK